MAQRLRSPLAMPVTRPVDRAPWRPFHYVFESGATAHMKHMTPDMVNAAARTYLALVKMTAR